MNHEDVNSQENKHQQSDSPFLRHMAAMEQQSGQGASHAEEPKEPKAPQPEQQIQTSPSQPSIPEQDQDIPDQMSAYSSFGQEVPEDTSAGSTSRSAAPMSGYAAYQASKGQAEEAPVSGGYDTYQASQGSQAPQDQAGGYTSYQAEGQNNGASGEQPQANASEQPSAEEGPSAQPATPSQYYSQPVRRSKQPPKKKKSILPIILWVLALIVVVLAILPMLNLDKKKQTAGTITTTTMANLIETTTTTAATEPTVVTDPAEPTPEPTPIAFTQENMLPEMWELYSQNDDTVGFVTLYDQLALPVMFTPDDKEYYLHRNFNKENETGGTLFIDYHCSCYPRGTNLIIYGHNMKNGSMFNTLQYYLSEEFYHDYPTFSYKTLFEEETYEIFAVFRSKVYNVDDDVFKFYKFYDAANEAEFNDFVTNCKAMNLYEIDVTPQFGDDIVTLVTCEYSQDNGRFVVVGRKANPAQ